MLAAFARTFSLLIYLTVFFLFACLFLANRSRVEIELFPLPYTIGLPLFLVVVVSFVLGVLCAAFLSRLRSLLTKQPQAKRISSTL